MCSISIGCGVDSITFGDNSIAFGVKSKAYGDRIQRKRTLNHRAERACGYRSNLLMMDIKYDFKANPFKEKDGKPVLYPAVVVKETITTDHIVKELSKHSAYSAGCVVGVLQEVADMVVSHLRQGKMCGWTAWVRFLLPCPRVR